MLASLALACTGCDFQPEASAASLVQATGSNTSNGNELDLGIVFADRTGYVCLPLNRFGIQTADEIGALDSSCDCVRPTLVSYQLSKASTADALLLQFIPESAARDAIHPAWLEVHVTISLRSGETREVIANFLNTTAVDKEQAP